MPSEIIKFNGGISRFRNASVTRPYEFKNARLELLGTVRALSRGGEYDGPRLAKPFVFAWGDWLDDTSTAKAIACQTAIVNYPVEDAFGDVLYGKNDVYVEALDGTMEQGQGLPYIKAANLEKASFYEEVATWGFEVDGALPNALKTGPFGMTVPDDGSCILGTFTGGTVDVEEIISLLPELYWYFTSLNGSPKANQPSIGQMLKVRDIGYWRSNNVYYINFDVGALGDFEDIELYDEVSGLLVVDTPRAAQGISVGHYVTYVFVPFNVRREQGPPHYFYYECAVDQAAISAVPLIAIEASAETEYVEVYRTVEHDVITGAPSSNLYYFDKVIHKGMSDIGEGALIEIVVNAMAIVGTNPCDGGALTTETIDTYGIYITATYPPAEDDNFQVTIPNLGTYTYIVGSVTEIRQGVYHIMPELPISPSAILRFHGLMVTPPDALIMWDNDPCLGRAAIVQQAQIVYTAKIPDPSPPIGDNEYFWHRDIKLWTLDASKFAGERQTRAVSPTSHTYDAAISATVKDEVLHEILAETIWGSCGKTLYGDVAYPTKDPRIIYQEVTEVTDPQEISLIHVAIQYEYRLNNRIIRGPFVIVTNEEGDPVPVRALSVETGYSEFSLVVWLDVDRDGSWLRYETIPNVGSRYVSSRNEFIRSLGETQETIVNTYYTFNAEAYDVGYLTDEEPDEDLEQLFITERNAVIASRTGQPLSTEYAAIMLPRDEAVRAVASASLEQEESSVALSGNDAIYVLSDRAVRLYVGRPEGFQLIDVVNGTHGIAIHPDDDSPIMCAVPRGMVYVDTEQRLWMMAARQQQRLDVDVVTQRKPLEAWNRDLYTDLWTQIVSIAYHARHAELYVLTDTGTHIYSFGMQGWIGHYDYAYPTYKHVAYINESPDDDTVGDIFVVMGTPEPEEDDPACIMLDESESALQSTPALVHNKVVYQPLFVDTEPVWIHEVRVDYEPLTEERPNGEHRAEIMHSVAAGPLWVNADPQIVTMREPGATIMPRRSLYPRMKGVAHQFQVSNFKEVQGMRYWFVPYMPKH